MSCDLSDAAIDKGLEALRQHAIDWLVFNYVSKDALAVRSMGSNGLEELKVSLRHNQQEAQFGLLCLENKTLLFNVIPESIGGVKRARAVVHTTAIRNRVSAYISALTVLSVQDASALTISAVRVKLKLSHVPLVASTAAPDLMSSPALQSPITTETPPLPPKDYPSSPQMLSTPESDVGSTSTYFTTETAAAAQQDYDELGGLYPTAPLQARKRAPSPIMVPTEHTPTLRGAEAQSPLTDEGPSASFLSYLQNGSVPNSPVESTHQRPEHRPLPLSPLSPKPDSLNPPISPSSHNTTDDLIDQYATSPKGIPDSIVPDTIEEEPEEPAPMQRSESDNIKLEYQSQSERQSSNTLTDLAHGKSLSQKSSPRVSTDATECLAPPSRSSSLMHSLSSSQYSPSEQRQQSHQHNRGPSNASSAVLSPVNDNYSESISTTVTSATGDSSSSALASSHRKSRDAAVEAEMKRQAAWEADAPRRRTLPLAEQTALEGTEFERRAAADRQKREMQWRHAMAEQELTAAEDAERQKREAVERQEHEEEEQRIRAEQAEQKRLEAEEKKRQAAEAKAAKQVQLKEQLEQLSVKEGSTMLDGFVSVQQPNSTLWRRRWFQLQPRRLALFKDAEDTTKPMSTLDLAGLRISDGFEETQVAHSFILQTAEATGQDPTSFYCDEEADKELLTEALKIAATS